jgi:hypothetical protein
MRYWKFVAASPVSIALITVVVGVPTLSRVASMAPHEPPQAPAQTRAQPSLVTFEFTQDNSTTDQVTIIFTNAPVPASAPPLTFGEDIIEEFSFLGADFRAGGPVRFSRRVRDRSFLDARFIRVVNPGTNRWEPTTISLTVDGERVLDNVRMTPRKGANPEGGLQRWNRNAWTPTYWEAELQKYRR